MAYAYIFGAIWLIKRLQMIVQMNLWILQLMIYAKVKWFLLNILMLFINCWEFFKHFQLLMQTLGRIQDGPPETTPDSLTALAE